MDSEEKQKRKEDDFNKHLNKLLSNFENNREWADIGNWLQKIENLLIEYKTPQIRDKITFSKRLAQCLNPIIPPGTHSQALNVYRLLFQNMKIKNGDERSIRLLAQDMGIYSFGLFPFFQLASSQIKPKILTLIKDFYFPLKTELIPCIPGLVLSLLPGLDEQNEELQKQIFSIFEQAENCVGKKYIIGAVWMAILRSSKNRGPALKYLSKTIPKLKIEQEEEHTSDDEYEDDITDEEENDEEKDISSGKVNYSTEKKEKNILEESKQIMNNKNLEEKSFHGNENLNSGNLDDTDKKKKNLMDEINEECKLIKEKEEKKNENDPPNYDIIFPNKSTLVVNCLVACLEEENVHIEKLVLDFMYYHVNISFDYFDDKDKLILVEAVLHNLIKKENKDNRREYNWLFGKPDSKNKYNMQKNEKVLDLIIQSFINIIKNITLETINTPLNIMKKFYRELADSFFIEYTIKKICLPLFYHIYKYKDIKDKKDETKTFVIQGERLILSFTSYNELILVSYFETLEKEIMNKNDFECLNIIKLIEFLFTDDLKVLKYSNSCLENTIMKILEVFGDFTKENLLEFKFIHSAFELALKINDKLEKNIGQNNLKEELIENEKDNENKVKSIVILKPNYNFELILQKFSDLFKLIIDEYTNIDLNEENNENVDLFINSSKIIVKIQRFLTQKELKVLPEWFRLEVKCLKCNNKHIRIRAIETIIDILNFENVDLIYKNLKNLIINDCKTLKEEEQKDYSTEIIEILWTYLDYNGYQNKTVELIIDFEKYFPESFKEVSARALSIDPIPEKEKAMRRFATFWKLTNENSNIREENLNKTLFIMLDYLNHDNPLIRHTAKSWLINSKDKLSRIIDPIFNILILDNSIYEITEIDEIYYKEEYNTEEVIKAFKRIKSILITANEEFISYISTNRIGELKEIGIINKKEHKYVDLLALVSLKFLKGQVRKEGSEFFLENCAVNAFSSELLELLIKQIIEKSTSRRITSIIIEPLLVIIRNAINRKDIVMQVQAMNLLNLIFHSSYCSLDNLNSQAKDDRKKEIITLLSSDLFINILLEGIQTEISYMRVQFINFITEIINIISFFLQNNNILSDRIKKILDACFSTIEKLKGSNDAELESYESIISEMNEIIKRKIIKDKKFNSTLNEMSSFEKTQMQISSDKKKTFNQTKHSNNPFSEIQQNQNQIFILIDAIKTILNHYLKFIEIKEEEKKGAFQNVLLLVNIKSNIVCKETKEQLTLGLQKTIDLLISCWSTSSNFMDHIKKTEFSNCGRLKFISNNEGFSKELNQVISVYYQDNKVEINTPTIKGQIICILNKLFFQFTYETANALVDIWIKEFNVKFGEKPQINYKMNKEIETLIFLLIPPDFFINAMGKISLITQIKAFYSNSNNWKRKNTIFLNYEYALKESRFLFFIYSYFSYVYKSASTKDLITTWKSFISFLEPFENSKNPNTLFWIFEIFDLLNKKYWPEDKELKKLMINKLNTLIIELANISYGKYDLVFDSIPPEKSIKNKSEIQDKFVNYYIILPLPPTLYDLYNRYFENNNDNNAYDKDIGDILFGKNEFTNQELIKIYRIMGYEMLTKLYQFLLYSSKDEKQKSIERTIPAMNIILQTFSTKTPENQIYIECASKLLSELYKESEAYFVKEFKTKVSELFQSNDFFKCSKKTLKYWSKIIETLYKYDKGELFADLLSKISLSTSFFNQDADIKRIRNFVRICFVIYSSEKDKYEKLLNILLEKIKDVINNQEITDQPLLILILFCMRILILRLSPKALNTLFRTLWPMLLSLLMNILKKESKENKENNKSHPIFLNLILSALKLIELISTLQLEEFYLHQWIFVFDYFGIKIEDIEKKENCKFLSPFQYEPYIINYLPDDQKIKYCDLDKKNKENSYQKKKRDVIISVSLVKTEEELREKAISLSNYLITFNEYRSQLNNKQIEDLIENDFISLEEYIYSK